MEKTAIGLMNGTSMDGIDAAVIRTDGREFIERGENIYLPYPAETRKIIVAAITAAKNIPDCIDHSGVIGQAEEKLDYWHARAIAELLAKSGLQAEQIDLIGMHGQTILHRPEQNLSLQLGNADRLAEVTGIDVVYDFRSSDIMAGGQGAPLVPVYHRTLARDLEKPLAVVNIGGIANITWIGTDGGLHAFDTGPGNCLLDAWAMRHLGKPMDENGKLAASGTLIERILSRLLAHPYLSQDPPKSLDRSDFDLAPLEGLSPANGAATLVTLTAMGIVRADFFLPQPPKTWIITGGGARNPALMAELGKRLDGKVTTAEEFGWSSEFMEAEAFAYLAVRSSMKLPITYPETTGAPEPLTGGRYCPAPRR
jgi:anhydro-N-acetylmuramic acid kinase